MWPALAAAQIPVLSVSPAILAFAASRAEAPPSQQVRIRNTGSGALQWTATAADPWVRVSPGRGTGPALLTITIDAARLGIGRHDSRLTIDAGDADDSPVSLPISVEVTAAVLPEAPPARCPVRRATSGLDATSPGRTCARADRRRRSRPDAPAGAA